nr:MAG TPA: hypothetical protein [Caudoviricetes sp.]
MIRSSSKLIEYGVNHHTLYLFFIILIIYI